MASTLPSRDTLVHGRGRLYFVLIVLASLLIYGALVVLMMSEAGSQAPY